MRVRKRSDDLEKRLTRKWGIGIAPVTGAKEVGEGMGSKVSGARGPPVSSTCIGDWKRKVREDI